MTVDYATAGGTAEEGADYTATSATLTFAPGENAQTIAVSTREDEVDEHNETFTLNLSNPGSATIQDGTATGTINDDDEPPAIVIADAEAEEGEAAEFTVTLSAITSFTVTVDYATAGGTAEEGADYTATSGTLTFAPGENAQTIAVSTREDEVDEQDETFTLNVSNPGRATIQDGTATGTINDDDEPLICRAGAARSAPSRSITEIPSLGLATNASLPSGDAVTSCGPCTVATCPSTLPAAGSTTARALASRSSTSSRASRPVWAAAPPAPARKHARAEHRRPSHRLFRCTHRSLLSSTPATLRRAGALRERIRRPVP